MGAGRPVVAADLARPRQGIPTPQYLAGLGVECRQPAADAKFPAGDTAIDDTVVVEGFAGDPTAVLPYLGRGLLHLFAGLDVERHNIGVELTEEQQAFAHRQAAVNPAAADRRDLLVDPGPPFPQNLAGLGVECENVLIAGHDIHDPVLDQRRGLEGVLTATNPEPLSRVIQAPLSCLTLVVSICFSAE